MKRRGLLHFIPLWPLLLLGLGALVWHQRLEVATWILDRLVVSGDIENLGIRPSRIGLDRSLIESITFTSRTGDEDYQVRASGIEVAYTFSNFKTFSVNRVGIEKLSIRQFDAASLGRSNEPSPTLAQVLADIKRGLALTLPAESLFIAQLDLILPRQNLRINNGRVNVKHTADGDDNGSGKRVHVRIEDGPRFIDLELRSDKLVAMLGAESVVDNDILAIELLPSESNELIMLNLRLNTSGLAQWLSHYPAANVIIAPLQSWKAKANIEISARPYDQGYLAQISAQSDQVSTRGIEASGVSATTSFYLTDEWIKALPSRYEFDVSTELKAAKIETDDLKISNLQFHPQGVIENQGGTLIATFNPGSRISAKSVFLENYKINGLEVQPLIILEGKKLKVLKGTKTTAELVSGSGFSLKKTTMFADQSSVLMIDDNGGFVHKDGLWAIATEIDLEDDRKIGGKFHAAISQMDITTLKTQITGDGPDIELGTPLPAIQTLSVDVTRKDELIEAVGSLKTHDSDTPFEFSVAHDIDAKTGQGRLWNTSAIAAADAITMATSLDLQLPDTLFIDSGALNIELDARWDAERLLLASDIKADDFSGVYEESRFDNVEVQGKLDLLPAVKSDGNLLARIGTLEYGIAVENLSSEFGLAPSPHGELPQLSVSSIQGEVLGSSFLANNFTLDLNKPDTQLDLKIQNLDIEKVVATQNVEGLEATGQIDGALPVTISAEGISIQDGIFWNHLAGGNIVYSISDEQAAALDNPLTDVVIQALRDFRYRVLNVNTSYRPNGDLFMDFHFEGISPLIDPDRAVHLNINSEQNVLSLLKSLSYSEGVNKTLDKQIQEQFE